MFHDSKWIIRAKFKCELIKNEKNDQMRIPKLNLIEIASVNE